MILPLPLHVRQTAFQLALHRPWHHVTLEAIARESGLSLSELRQVAQSKAAILSGFSRDIDESMLTNLARHPPTGEPHDRLFDVMIRRLEIMSPYRESLAGILGSPVVDPDEGIELFSAANRAIGWMLAAAGVESERQWRGMKRLALLHAYWKVLQVWAEDDDPGLARTMAALDRRLRDAQARSETLRTLVDIAASARRMAAAFWTRDHQQRTEDP